MSCSYSVRLYVYHSIRGNVETPKGYWVVSLADRMLRVRPEGQGAYLLEVRKRYECS